jgi:proteasome lid subunit RPN8/RPN11
VDGVERLTIPAAVAESMLDHARAGLPNEACGILAGDVRAGLASAFHPARNEQGSPWRYSVHPEDLVRIVLGIERRGEDVVGLFHSHVASAAEPSPTDIREARYPAAVHLVASLVDPGTSVSRALRGWRIADGRAREVPLVIG